MAAGNSDYNRGDMPIEAQNQTFSGFMVGSTYSTAYIIVLLIMPILVFGVNLSWFPALIATVVIGGIIGIALKFKGFWYASLIVLAILTAILCVGISALT